jgi:hypothetical protein
VVKAGTDAGAHVGDLVPAVEAALGHPVHALEHVRRESIDYDAFLAHRQVARIRGTAVTGGGRQEWSLIEKTTAGPALAVPYLTKNAVRELRAYTSGLLDDLGAHVLAPRVYDASVGEDGAIVLRLEEVRHDGRRPLDAETLLEAARDLGGLAAQWHGRVPADPWLFDGWIDRHSQPEAMRDGLSVLRRRHPSAVARLGDRLRAGERLIAEQPRVRELLQNLPQTLCHHDAVGANVFRSRAGTVLIDWESVGPGAVGADLASLLFSSVRRGDARASVVVPLLDEAVGAYTAAVRQRDASLSAATVRLGFDAAVVLRWKLIADVARGLERGEPARRGSLPDEPPETATAELVKLCDVLLSCASRARDARTG